MRRGIVVTFAIAVALALPQTALAAKIYPPSIFSVDLLVDESLPGFVLPPGTLKIPQGTTKFTTIVPEKANGQHGIGIDGGPYKNIRGAYVKPGRSSSLTVALKPGDYTVFDSYKRNRSAGYSVKVRVTHAKQKHISYGTLCPISDIFDISRTWVKNVTCRSAHGLIDAAYAKWDGEGVDKSVPVIVREFTCYYAPVSAVGKKVACLADGARVTNAG